MFTSMRSRTGRLCALTLAVVLTACGGGGGSDAEVVGTTPPPTTTPVPTDPTNPPPTTPVSQAALSGKALDGSTGQGIEGATVRVGSLSTRTAADGSFTLAGVPAGGRIAVVFAAPAYAENTRIANVVADTTTDVQARLVRVGASATVPVAAGGTVTVPGSPAQVTLPANGVQRADGSTPTGNITVRVTPIDPAVDTTLMPGDFLAAANGANTPIESFGALDVTLTDDTGAPLNLRSGQTASLRIPLRSRSGSPPSTVPLFFFDTTAGIWREEGSATLVGSGASAYYEGPVSHLTTWNADQYANTVLVRGCVKDAAGNPLANATVTSDGIDYSGTSYATTSAAGEFSLAVRRASLATITGVSGGRLTNTVRNTPSSNDTTLPDCLALGQNGAGVTMKLTWGARPSDLDSHLITPAGNHVYYSSKGSLTAAPFANLDVDDTTSYGPEVVTITRLMVGTYTYYVNNYSGFANGPIGQSGARVELNIPGVGLQLLTPPEAGESSGTNNWNVFEFDVNAACAITVRQVRTYSANSPTRPTTEPQYCTAAAR